MSDRLRCKRICKDFVDAIGANFPCFAKKIKVHLMLHLVDCMMDLGLQLHLTLKGITVYNYELFSMLFNCMYIKGVKHLIIC